MMVHLICQRNYLSADLLKGESLNKLTNWRVTACLRWLMHLLIHTKWEKYWAIILPRHFTFVRKYEHHKHMWYKISAWYTRCSSMYHLQNARSLNILIIPDVCTRTNPRLLYRDFSRSDILIVIRRHQATSVAKPYIHNWLYKHCLRVEPPTHRKPTGLLS